MNHFLKIIPAPWTCSWAYSVVLFYYLGTYLYLLLENNVYDGRPM